MMGEGRVTADGVHLRYVRAGEGPPLLVVGWSGYHKMFSPELSRHFDIAFADCRHFAPTHKATSEELDGVTLATFVEEAEAVRKALQVESMAVLGQSAHAQIALAYACKYPKRISHTVLVCGVPFGFDELTAVQERYWEEHASEQRKAIFARDQEAYADALRTAPPEQQFGIFYLSHTAKYWADPEYDAKALTAEFRANAALDRLFASIPSKAEVRASLEQLGMPTLVVTGGHDYICPPTTWEDLTADLSGIHYQCLDESGHNPQTEHPEMFDRLLLDWFQATLTRI